MEVQYWRYESEFLPQSVQEARLNVKIYFNCRILFRIISFNSAFSQLEAGGDETELSDVPALAANLQLSPLDWKYKTEPQPGKTRMIIKFKKLSFFVCDNLFALWSGLRWWQRSIGFFRKWLMLIQNYPIVLWYKRFYILFSSLICFPHQN